MNEGADCYLQFDLRRSMCGFRFQPSMLNRRHSNMKTTGQSVLFFEGMRHANADTLPEKWDLRTNKLSGISRNEWTGHICCKNRDDRR